MIYDKRILILLAKLDKLSFQYHKLSCLMHELKESCRIQANHGMKYKEITKSLTGLDIDAQIALLKAAQFEK